ncbi:hypothetical protein B0H14DRAFT_3460012 [Mycena olivaceomarginata]|nr:hypothetical protein B0H14DRAFT_3460012 [Mycena olivaceomarginata]
MITPALLPLLLVAFVLSSILAQVVSPYWRKPNITASPAERINLAGAALAEAVNQLNPATQFFPNATSGAVAGYKGSFYGQMAEFDLITKQTMWEKSLKTYFQVAQSAHVYHALTYGRAAALAYAAYKDQTFLDYAMQSWWFGRAYTLSQDDVSAGRISAKNLSPLQEVCQNLLEAIYAPQNYSCEVINEIFPYNTGITIEGLSILAALTNDTETQNLLEQILATAIPYSLWQGSDGVIAEVNQYNTTQTTGDLNLVQGLAAAYARNATSVDMHAYIGHYLAVQFNAVVDLATMGGTNIYGSSWVGPPSSTYLGQDQTSALSALIAALVVSHDSVPSSSAPSTTFLATHPGKTKAVPIANGTSLSTRATLAQLVRSGRRV